MTIRLSYEDIAREIVSRCEPSRVNLVAVDGPSGSGKSVLTEHLAPMLQAPIIEMDDFLSWGDLESWWPRFEEQVIQPLATGKPARYQCRDWENDYLGDALNEWKTVQRAPIMFFEGVSSSRLAIAAQLSLAIWVEAPREVRLQRGLARDTEQFRLQWQRFMAMEDDWFQEDNTLWRAELKLDGDPPEGVDSAVEMALLDT